MLLHLVLLIALRIPQRRQIMQYPNTDLACNQPGTQHRRQDCTLSSGLWRYGHPNLPVARREGRDDLAEQNGFDPREQVPLMKCGLPILQEGNGEVQSLKDGQRVIGHLGH